MTTTQPASDQKGRSTWVAVLVDVVAPVAGFYVLRAAGVGQVTALLAGGAAPAARGLYLIARHRRYDVLAALTLAIIIATVATSLITGDARFALARDAVITFLVGVVILVTLRAERPFIYSFCVTFMGAAEKRLWSECWDRSSTFRHGMGIHTAIWGVGMIIDAAIRVLIAYTLPVDVVPLVNAVQYGVLICVLLVISVIYSRIAGLVPGSPDYPAKPEKHTESVKQADDEQRTGDLS